MSLFEEINKTSNPKLVIAWGQVVSVGPPLSVRIARDQIDVTVGQWLDSYTPVETDKVLLAKIGPGWIVLGKLVSA